MQGQHALPVREAAKAVPIRRCAPFPQPHHPDVSLQGAKQRGALSAKREEVPLGCNLGEAVAISLESSCVIRPGTARLHGPFAAVQRQIWGHCTVGDTSQIIATAIGAQGTPLQTQLVGTFLSAADANRKCCAGPGCPLPYNGPHKNHRLPKKQPVILFLQAL